MLPTDAAARKAIPIYSGFIKYFPRGIIAVAQLSHIGNEQHNPGSPLFWDRSKSGDELDALMRHTIDEVLGEDTDVDGVLHATKRAWRAMADLEKKLESIDVSLRAVFDASSPNIGLADGHTDPYPDCKLCHPEVLKVWEVEGEGEPDANAGLEPVRPPPNVKVVRKCPDWPDCSFCGDVL